MKFKAPQFELSGRGRFLHLDLPVPHDCLSWTVVGGGRQRASRLSWCKIERGELAPDVDPAALVRQWLEGEERPSEVVLMTSRRLDAHEYEVACEGEWSAACIATVGLGNALRPGDPARHVPPLGTINLGMVVSHPLSECAALEALALVSAARAMAVSEAGLRSTESGLAASGTGTDCIAVLSPVAGVVQPWVGMHTKLGELLGGCALRATARGVQAWMSEREAKRERGEIRS